MERGTERWCPFLFFNRSVLRMKKPATPSFLTCAGVVLYGSGRRNRTYDLEIMSLASCHCSIPRNTVLRKFDTQFRKHFGKMSLTGSEIAKVFLFPHSDARYIPIKATYLASECTRKTISEPSRSPPPKGIISERVRRTWAHDRFLRPLRRRGVPPGL